MLPSLSVGAAFRALGHDHREISDVGSELPRDFGVCLLVDPSGHGKGPELMLPVLILGRFALYSLLGWSVMAKVTFFWWGVFSFMFAHVRHPGFLP